MAGGLLPGERQNDSCSGPDQELLGLRSFSAHPDRLHHRTARMRRGYQEDLRRVSETARCADSGIESSWVAGGAPQGNDVRVGSIAGGAQASGIARVFEDVTGKRS